MTDNQDQADYWSGAPGRKWIDYAVELDAMHQGALDLLLDHAALQSGERVLDVGCGAGASTIAAARQVAPGGHVLGLDISAPLIALGQERAAKDGVQNLDFLHGDAQLVRPETPVDVLISRFGMMFFADPVSAFANLAATLRPGGRMAFVAWCAPDQNPWFGTAAQIAGRHLPADGPADPHAPGPTAFADGARVVGLMEAAGLKGARVSSHDISLRPPGGLEAAVSLAMVIGPAGRLVSLHQPDEAVRRALASDLREAFGALSGDGAFAVPARVNLFQAEV